MDDDLGTVPIDEAADAIRGIQIERRPAPRQWAEWAGERGVLERCDDSTPESSAGTRHRHAHGYASVDAASLAPYWRS
jgi:hypothetical protein